ncbi:S9 family peptidase [Olivibacter domesticus]|uniref:Dipeptidyl-peptidase-4 n=1 Tax=Olivibacter domesticus TaxID=407022 RepID=A0A1H7SHT6_OLID1|nr:DPP IV N-terminal domain-containing protein [Olivibacter domesticus]SEL72055.1 dipeptidyl-peptidase-4 [Olivibacter domesticus]
MKSAALLLTLALGCNTICAQQKQFTIDEATLGMQTSLAAENIKQLSWIPGENTLAHIVKTNYGEAFISKSIPSQQVDTLLRLPAVNQSLFGKSALKAFPPLQWVDANTLYFEWQRRYFIASKQGKEWQAATWLTLPENAENASVEPNTKQLAYTHGNNLFLVNNLGKTIQVTKDLDGDIVNGQSVHRQEFGIDHGIFFSPKGNYLAFYRMDQRMVENYPLINWDDTPATVHYTKYPFAGRTSHEVTLGVYNPKTEQTTFLQTGEPKDHYLTCVTWSPDEKFIYVAILNREQNHLWLNQYDAQHGNFIKTLFEESDPKYVQPIHTLHFLPGKTDEFVWWSQRDGFMHLYRYDINGKLLNQITKGDWLVNEISGVNANKKTLYITSTKDSPMEKHLYAVNWENGKMERLDHDAGVHQISINSNGTYGIDNWSNGTIPRVIDVISTEKKWKQRLLTAANTLEGYQRPKIEDVTLKAEDNTPLYGKLIYPTNFDATKKYPVIVYLYNGPNVQLLSNSFPASGNLWYEYMAQRGYLVFSMDGRGSSNRGLRFEQATFRHLGTVEMADQMQGVNYLTSLPFVDVKRMGIHGWSYGGFMTTSFMLRKPDVFKVGVAGGPVMDWKMYEAMYTERYMDSPQENPHGYEEANLLDKTKDLKGKLLLIHGTMDSTVVWQHSIKFLKEAIKTRTQIDYFVYPGYEHNVRGYDRIHLMQKISDYFDLYLKSETAE